jgi:phosphatidylglycerophosphate synthase
MVLLLDFIEKLQEEKMNLMYSLKNIEETFKERSWWAIIASLFPAKYITYYIANHTNITPNQITLISFIFAIFSGISFFFGFFIMGAFLYQVSYIFDIVDGSLARVQKKSSQYGAFLDVFTDWIKAPILIVILLYVQNQLIFLTIILLLLSWVCCANKYNDMLFYTKRKSLSEDDKIQKSKIGKYFQRMESKNIAPLAGNVEFEALILFFYPITQLQIFIYFSVTLLLLLFILKVYIIFKKVK